MNSRPIPWRSELPKLNATSDRLLCDPWWFLPAWSKSSVRGLIICERKMFSPLFYCQLAMPLLLYIQYNCIETSRWKTTPSARKMQSFKTGALWRPVKLYITVGPFAWKLWPSTCSRQVVSQGRFHCIVAACLKTAPGLRLHLHCTGWPIATHQH